MAHYNYKKQLQKIIVIKFGFSRQAWGVLSQIWAS